MRRRGVFKNRVEPIEVAASRIGAQDDVSHGNEVSPVVSGDTSTQANISFSVPKCSVTAHCTVRSIY